MVGFWIIVAAVMAVVEAVTCGVVSVWFVVGALVAFVLAFLGVPFIVQLLVFAAVSVACLVCLRPMAKSRMNRGDSAEPTMVGKRGVVTVEPDEKHSTYRVKLENGADWAARPAEGAKLVQGDPVEVVGQESAVLLVRAERAE